MCVGFVWVYVGVVCCVCCLHVFWVRWGGWGDNMERGGEERRGDMEEEEGVRWVVFPLSPSRGPMATPEEGPDATLPTFHHRLRGHF